MGTPNYMPPEQARGKNIDRQTNIFSFGVVLYEMLSGESPFDSETVSDVYIMRLSRRRTDRRANRRILRMVAGNSSPAETFDVFECEILTTDQCNRRTIC